VPTLVTAHGTGLSYEVAVDPYLVDVGYGTEIPTVGQAVPFDFALTEKGETVPYTHVWVTMKGEDGIVLATSIYNSPYGGPRLSYVFEKPGTYTVFMRYERGSEVLARASFPITVAGSAHSFRWLLPLPIPALLFVGGYMYMRRSRNALAEIRSRE